MDGSPDLLQRYTQQRDAGDTAGARATLALALQTPRYRAPALVEHALLQLRAQRPQPAFLALAEAMRTLHDEPSLAALLGRAAMDQQQPALAARLLDAAWVRHAGHLQLRTIQWAARVASQPPVQTARQMHAAWPHMQADERRFVSEQLQRMRAPLPEEPAASPTPNAPDTQTETPTRTPGTWSLAPAAPTTTRLARPGHRAAPPPSTARPVDVLIPVYNGGEAVMACLRTVLQHIRANRTPHRVIVLDDASTDRALQTMLRDLAAKGHIAHVRQPENLGFIGNINHGMQLNPDHDVVWLNADTRVHGNWLDRLRAAAYASKATATATPFSNNGELLSFPVMRERAAMPNDAELAQLNTAAQTLPAKPVPIEVGCGFCFFIKRAALDAVGLLDGEHLQRGYGEETDWCLRARALGWQHVAATNVFVTHEGGVSFGDEKPLRVKHNNAVLRRRYPEAEARFHRFVRLDPLHPARQALQRARLKAVAARLRAGPPGDRQLCIADPRRAYLGLPAESARLRLDWRLQGQTEIRATVHAESGTLPVQLDYTLPADTEALRRDLKTLGVNGITFAHSQGAPALLAGLPATLKLPQAVRTSAWPAEPIAATPAVTNAITGAATAADAAPLALLVADAPGDAALAERWLALARQWARRPGPSPLLLLPATSAWWPALQATGIARALPEVEGLILPECLQLSGCVAALSLELAPDAYWMAPHLSSHAGIPLYAPPSATAQDAGAHGLAALVPPTGWPLAA
ncbi:glycosyltransferase family 2 protein [Achromobacter sp. GG226]|uniref:glycosyltransferase family 2 protein n=1 Tax=Verticiella alkaliphila TaxID=2779529 RepID=UPI001C0C693F|nr:glycosyltransferase family 2 protein [Verticiella sp. GG226]MBU4609706.1 glycosyltransferase family 2 protein [Verticiella sp. GG226]